MPVACPDPMLVIHDFDDSIIVYQCGAYWCAALRNDKKQIRLVQICHIFDDVNFPKRRYTDRQLLSPAQPRVLF